ncbi:MAG: type II secretion system F family protein [Candidatus Nucleicultricaceae bacterium]|jgi:Flp pilus assembly protein TadB
MNFLEYSTIAIFLISGGFFIWSFLYLRKTTHDRARKERLEAFSMPEVHSFIAENQGIFKESQENQVRRKINDFLKNAAKDRRPTLLKKILINPHLKIIAPISIVVFIIVYEVAYKYLLQPRMISVAFGILVSAVFSSFIYSILENKRQQIFLKNFPTALDLITRGLRAGLSIDKTFFTISRELPNIVGKEFEIIMQQISLGVPFETALINAAMAVKIADFDFFVASLVLQRQVGGSIADFMENVSKIVRKREELRLKIKSMSSEARATGIIIGSLPFVTLGVISFIRPDYLDVFRHHPTGQKLFLVAISLIIFAGFIVNRMTKINLD